MTDKEKRRKLSASRMAWGRKMKSLGRCIVCGKPAGKSQRTGKLMHRCRKHQNMVNGYAQKKKKP